MTEEVVSAFFSKYLRVQTSEDPKTHVWLFNHELSVPTPPHPPGPCKSRALLQNRVSLSSVCNPAAHKLPCVGAEGPPARLSTAPLPSYPPAPHLPNTNPSQPTPQTCEEHECTLVTARFRGQTGGCGLEVVVGCPSVVDELLSSPS